MSDSDRDLRAEIEALAIVAVNLHEVEATQEQIEHRLLMTLIGSLSEQLCDMAGGGLPIVGNRKLSKVLEDELDDIVRRGIDR